MDQVTDREPLPKGREIVRSVFYSLNERFASKFQIENSFQGYDFGSTVQEKATGTRGRTLPCLPRYRLCVSRKKVSVSNKTDWTYLASSGSRCPRYSSMNSPIVRVFHHTDAPQSLPWSSGRVIVHKGVCSPICSVRGP